MLLINLLGAVAIVDGLWSKTLLVSGTVTTGDLAGVWGPITTNDSGATPDPCTPGVNPSPCPTTPTNVGACNLTGGVGSASATVAITNAYASYECTITGNISNLGSVPFNVIGARLLFTQGNDAGLEQLGACSLPSDIQIDPGTMKPVACTVHVRSTATPGWTYYFALETCVAQWNEDPSGSQPVTDFDACKNSQQHEGPTTPVLTAPHPTPPS